MSTADTINNAEVVKGGNGKVNVDDEIKRLAQLAPVQYEQERKAAAERLGVRASVLDRLVAAERPVDESGKQGRGIEFPEPEPWPSSVDGASLLDSLAAAIGRHVVMPAHSLDAAALWCAHSFLLDCFMVSPRLAVHSPVKQCGKTTLLNVIERLVLRPLPTANVTSSATFRVVEACRPALLIDEADTFLRENEELRGVLNSGHRRGGTVIRTVGDDFEPRAFATYSACAIALIGKLPDTLHDRSVVIDLKRRLPGERVESFRPDRAGHLDDLARRIARWAKDHADRISEADPTMPDGIYNREADNWRPLLSIADVAGGHWPGRARAAALKCHEAADDESRIVVLLTDIKAIFTEKDTDRLASADLVDSLVAIQGRPWADYGKNDKPMTQNQLARMMKPIAIAPEVIRVGTGTARGYRIDQFTEAFERYLASQGDSNRNTVTNADTTGISDTFQTVTPESDVTVEKCKKSNNDGLCYGVTVGKGEKSGNGGERPPERVCTQCGGPGDERDRLAAYPANGHGVVWLHRACQPFWFDTRPDPFDIPEFLQRN